MVDNTSTDKNIQVKKKVRKKPYISNKVCNITDWVPTVLKPTTSDFCDSWFDSLIHFRPDINVNEISSKVRILCPIISSESFKQQMQTINKSKSKIKKSPEFIYSKKIQIYPDDEQSILLDQWFDACTKMFNCTIDYIRKRIYKNHELIRWSDAKFILNFGKIRGKLSVKKKQIQLDSSKIKAKRIQGHILDAAINQAVTNHKSALSNLIAGNIRHFRVRKLSTDRDRKILKIEAAIFLDGERFCEKAFGKFKSSTPIKNITRECILQYDRANNKYTLYVPKSIKPEYIRKRNTHLGIDLGVRTFITAYSEKGVIDMCTSRSQVKIKRLFRKIDVINKLLYENYNDNNENNGNDDDFDEFFERVISKQEKEIKKELKNKENNNKQNKNKNKNEESNEESIELLDTPNKKIPSREKLLIALRKYHKQITDAITDMHFKTSHKLVNEFGNIAIGKLSTSSILSRNNKTISRQTKRMLQTLAPYKFRQRLMYMGNKYGCNVREVDEYLTTKTCSNCGNIKEMGSKKVYNCRCGMKTGRDENSAKTHMKLGIQLEQQEKAKEKAKKRAKVARKKLAKKKEKTLEESRRKAGSKTQKRSEKPRSLPANGHK